MSVELLESAADALGDLLEEVVFVGGATLTLWITDPGPPAVRPTKDVDVVAEVTSWTGFRKLEGRLRARSQGLACRPARLTFSL